ncbi:eukaryotic elongation factor 2 kinase-like isoform X1 [Artemia franciscana]|uniref:eukaryotic elongation factor 2 kinase-like isoform X1 n=1 Tax=Artemia franciscana TaxID=6661 RepID=UPI0032DACA1D
MTYAAEAGDRAAMIFLAKVYDTGLNLGTRVRSWTEAVRLYSKAVAALTEMDDDGHFDGTMDDPQYQLIARQAEMYRDGGFGLEINYVKAAELFSTAADDAMESMKGRIASKYYELAEEMSALAEEA